MILPVLVKLDGRFWRMLSPRWQKEPLSTGSHLTGGRWNPVGTRALYLSSTYETAIEEYHRSLVRPGTLAAYDVRSPRIADLTNPQDLRIRSAIDEALAAEWLRLTDLEELTPPGWKLAKTLIEAGAHGALVPSLHDRSGSNLVLWRWAAGDGAEVSVIDPLADLG